VSRGTEKWLDAEMWENSSDCIAALRKRGYRIAVTHIAPDTVSFNETEHSLHWL
jgi:tRNA (guanosine-2'-O-)-methyltransferase